MPFDRRLREALEEPLQELARCLEEAAASILRHIEALHREEGEIMSELEDTASDEDVAAEEDDVVAAAPAPDLDLEAFYAEVDERKAKMEERGRVDIANTFVGYADRMRDDTDAALSAALRAEAEKRTAARASETGPYARARLAAKVVGGEYDEAP